MQRRELKAASGFGSDIPPTEIVGEIISQRYIAANCTCPSHGNDIRQILSSISLITEDRHARS